MKSPGPAIAWSDADLDTLSTVTHQDVDAAKAWWRQRCRPADRDLLDTGSDDERRNRTARAWVERQSVQAVAALADQLRTGALDTAGWQLAMMAEIKNGNICAVAVARGGWSRVRMDDYR